MVATAFILLIGGAIAGPMFYDRPSCEKVLTALVEQRRPLDARPVMQCVEARVWLAPTR